VYVNLDDFADSQHTLRILLQTVVPVGVDRVTDSGERWSAATCWCFLGPFPSVSCGRFARTGEGRGGRKAALFCWYVTSEPLHYTKLHLTGIWRGRKEELLGEERGVTMGVTKGGKRSN
jgi:hypothetical protein